MVCERCGFDFNGKFCPRCGQKATNRLFESMKRFAYDNTEEIISVLGNNAAQTFISTGVLGNGFAILSDKRVYFKGKCLIRKGKGFYSKIEEKSVDIKDVTGTGFVHNKATWAKVLSIIFLIFAVLFVLFTIVSLAALPPLLCAMGFGLMSLIFNIIYKIYNYSAFEISYAGGGIGFDMHFISEAESHEFQKQLNLLKDKIKATESTKVVHEKEIMVEPKNDSVPEQLKQYKELLDGGIISQEEFDAKKKQLLDL